MRAKNPENFVKFRWADFEIFRGLYVEPMAPIGQGEKTLHRSLFNVAGYSFTLCVVESSRSYLVATGHKWHTKTARDKHLLAIGLRSEDRQHLST